MLFFRSGRRLAIGAILVGAQWLGTILILANWPLAGSGLWWGLPAGLGWLLTLVWLIDAWFLWRGRKQSALRKKLLLEAERVPNGSLYCQQSHSLIISWLMDNKVRVIDRMVMPKGWNRGKEILGLVHGVRYFARPRLSYVERQGEPIFYGQTKGEFERRYLEGPQFRSRSLLASKNELENLLVEMQNASLL